MAHEPIEIERTYLLSGMPQLPGQVERWRIEQGYLPGNSAAQSGGLEGRLRRITHEDGRVECFHTIKRGEGLVRSEVERKISEGEFEEAWPSTGKCHLTKVRYRVQEAGLTWEIDQFDELDLVLAEVELPSVKAVVDPPTWLAGCILREVTNEPAYRNYRLALAISRGEPLPRSS